MAEKYPEIKQVCIYGTGGVGGYYGGRIADTLAKDKVKQREIYFIARGEHLKVIQQSGITVKTPQRTITAEPAAATSDFGKIPSPDLVLLCVKSYNLKESAGAIKKNIKENTVVIPLLNGIDIYERIRTDLVKGMVLPACVYLGTHIEKPGVINQSGGNGIILCGKDPHYPDFEAENVRQFFKETGIGFEWNKSAYPAIWEKYIFIAAFGVVTAASGKSLGEVMDDPKLRLTVSNIVREIAAIAKAKGVKLPEDIIERTVKKGFDFPYEARTSYQRDIEARAKQNEGDLYGGTILREGAALGIPAPATKTAYEKIQLLERNNRF